MRSSRSSIMFILAAVMILIMITISACTNQKQIKRQDFAMGTAVDIEVYGVNAEKAVQKVFEKINEIDRLMGVNIQDSDVSKINKMSGISPVKVDRQTLYVMQKAVHYSQLSDGKFDVSIQPLVELWDIGHQKDNDIPDEQKVKEILGYIGYQDIEIDEDGCVIFLKKRDMGIDLGGIAKGYAADEAAKILKDQGIKSAFISLGGNIFVIGSKSDGSPWKIGIQHPRKPRGNVAAVVEVEDKSVVTSGDYERFFKSGGKRYHHILDPDTGYPAWTGCISATVVADRSIDADALSTSIFLLGPQKGLELIENMDNTEAIIINDNMEVLVSSGLKGKVKITSEDFKLK
ncbi:MAG: FAD:protein FMN transferase [Clostridia bacterium]|nr:FAD:protein FMN transferase [Clostridia bacterium]